MFDDKFIATLATMLAPKVAALMPAPASSVVPRYLNLDQAAVYLSTTPAAVTSGLITQNAIARGSHHRSRSLGLESGVLLPVRVPDQVRPQE